MAGPRDTPYENGFFLVDIQLGKAAITDTFDILALLGVDAFTVDPV